jgi:hypothetical protein
MSLSRSLAELLGIKLLSDVFVTTAHTCPDLSGIEGKSLASLRQPMALLFLVRKTNHIFILVKTYLYTKKSHITLTLDQKQTWTDPLETPLTDHHSPNQLQEGHIYLQMRHEWRTLILILSNSTAYIHFQLHGLDE